MKGALIGCGALVAGFLLLVVIVFVVCLGYYNKEVSLRNQFNAQEKANTAIYDNVWKTISQQAEVSDKYKEDFKDVWKSIVEGQNAGNALNVFVNRHNPNFDSKIYVKLMSTIEGSRKEFTNNQVKLVDIKREHDNLRLGMPSSLIVGSKPELELKLVTSSKTNETFQTGKEDDVGVFKKK